MSVFFGLLFLLLQAWWRGNISSRQLRRAVFLLCISAEFRRCWRCLLQPPTRPDRLLPAPVASKVKPAIAVVSVSGPLSLPLTLVGAVASASAVAALPVSGRVQLRLLQTTEPSLAESRRLAKQFRWREATREEVEALLDRWAMYCPDGKIVLPGTLVSVYNPNRSVLVFYSQDGAVEYVQQETEGKLITFARIISSSRPTVTTLGDLRPANDSDLRQHVFFKKGAQVSSRLEWPSRVWSDQLSYFLAFAEDVPE